MKALSLCLPPLLSPLIVEAAAGTELLETSLLSTTTVTA